MKTKTNHLFFIGVAAIVLLIVAYTFNDSRFSEDYAKRILKSRVEKDKLFKEGEGSPLSKPQKEVFDELSYYPPAIAFRVEADYVLADIKEQILLDTNTGKDRAFLKFAKARFSLGGKQHDIWLLKPLRVLPGQPKNLLFLPFTDETCGITTHGSGRYIDLEAPAGPTIVIDFNQAYNPYCAYNEVYECPVPPKENHLGVLVEAGEKKFTENH